MKNSGIDPKTCLPDEAKFEAFMLQYRQQIMLYPKLSIDEVIQLWSLRKQIKSYVINDPVQNEIREQLRAILRLENLRM